MWWRAVHSGVRMGGAACCCCTGWVVVSRQERSSGGGGVSHMPKLKLKLRGSHTLPESHYPSGSASAGDDARTSACARQACVQRPRSGLRRGAA